MGWDSVKNEFYINNDHWSSAISVITYQWGVAPSNPITAPNWVEPYQAYSVSSTLNDPLLVSPVTYSWYVNGELRNTTTDPQVTVSAGDPWTDQQIELVATDVNGHSSATAYATVHASSGCPDRQDTC
jgi:hypothetical protein